MGIRTQVNPSRSRKLAAGAGSNRARRALRTVKIMEAEQGRTERAMAGDLQAWDEMINRFIGG